MKKARTRFIAAERPRWRRSDVRRTSRPCCVRPGFGTPDVSVTVSRSLIGAIVIMVDG